MNFNGQSKTLSPYNISTKLLKFPNVSKSRKLFLFLTIEINKNDEKLCCLTTIPVNVICLEFEPCHIVQFARRYRKYVGKFTMETMNNYNRRYRTPWKFYRYNIFTTWKHILTVLNTKYLENPNNCWFKWKS